MSLLGSTLLPEAMFLTASPAPSLSGGTPPAPRWSWSLPGGGWVRGMAP